MMCACENPLLFLFIGCVGLSLERLSVALNIVKRRIRLCFLIFEREAAEA